MFDTKTEPPLFLFTVTNPGNVRPERDALANHTVETLLRARGVGYKLAKQFSPEDTFGVREFNYVFIIAAGGNLALLRDIVCDPDIDLGVAIEFDCFRVVWALVFEDEDVPTRVPTGQNLINLNGIEPPAAQGYLDDFTKGQIFIAK